MKAIFETFGIIKDADKVKELMSRLEPNQRQFLDSLVKESSQRAWEDILIGLSKVDKKVNVSQKTINGWRIHYVEDLITQTGKCVCGHRIRYICYAEYVPNGSRIGLGSTCLQKYFSISMESARKIAIGMSDITALRDEVLVKLDRGWELDKATENALDEGLVMYSEDALRYFRRELPILCKHEFELEKQMNSLGIKNGGGE